MIAACWFVAALTFFLRASRRRPVATRLSFASDCLAAAALIVAAVHENPPQPALVAPIPAEIVSQAQPPNICGLRVPPRWVEDAASKPVEAMQLYHSYGGWRIRDAVVDETQAPGGDPLLVLLWRHEMSSDEGLEAYDYVVALDATDLSQRWQLGPCPEDALSLRVSPKHVVVHVRTMGYRIFDGDARELSRFRLSDASEVRGVRVDGRVDAEGREGWFGFPLSTLSPVEKLAGPPSEVDSTRDSELRRIDGVDVLLTAGPKVPGKRHMALLTFADVEGTTIWQGGPGLPLIRHGMLYGVSMHKRGLARLDPLSGEVLASHGFTDWSSETTGPFQMYYE